MSKYQEVYDQTSDSMNKIMVIKEAIDLATAGGNMELMYCNIAMFNIEQAREKIKEANEIAGEPLLQN